MTAVALWKVAKTFFSPDNISVRPVLPVAYFKDDFIALGVFSFDFRLTKSVVH